MRCCFFSDRIENSKPIQLISPIISQAIKSPAVLPTAVHHNQTNSAQPGFTQNFHQSAQNEPSGSNPRVSFSAITDHFHHLATNFALNKWENVQQNPVSTQISIRPNSTLSFSSRCLANTDQSASIYQCFSRSSDDPAIWMENVVNPKHHSSNFSPSQFNNGKIFLHK